LQLVTVPQTQEHSPPSPFHTNTQSSGTSQVDSELDFPPDVHAFLRNSTPQQGQLKIAHGTCPTAGQLTLAHCTHLQG